MSLFAMQIGQEELFSHWLADIAYRLFCQIWSTPDELSSMIIILLSGSAIAAFALAVGYDEVRISIKIPIFYWSFSSSTGVDAPWAGLPRSQLGPITILGISVSVMSPATPSPVNIMPRAARQLGRQSTRRCDSLRVLRCPALPHRWHTATCSSSASILATVRCCIADWVTEELIDEVLHSSFGR